MWDVSSQPKVPTNRLGISFIKDHHRPNSGFERISGQTLIFSLPRVNGHTAWCVYWWTHQKRYNLTVSLHWRMFEIQDVGGANIYPLEYILLAGIFDRPPPPPAAPGASCWPFLYFCVCADSTLLCVSVQPKTVLGWSRIFPHVNSGFTASPRDGSGLFLFLVNSFDIVSKNATYFENAHFNSSSNNRWRQEGRQSYFCNWIVTQNSESFLLISFS